MMASSPQIRLTPSPEQNVLAAINAKMAFQQQQIQQLINNEKVANENHRLFVKAVEEGFANVNKEIQSQAEKNRNTTRIWNMISAVLAFIVGKIVLPLFGIDIGN